MDHDSTGAGQQGDVWDYVATESPGTKICFPHRQPGENEEAGDSKIFISGGPGVAQPWG